METQLVTLRKTLLENFASYDALAKKLKTLPCAKGSAQEKLQINIGIMAGGFLSSEMGGLQVSVALGFHQQSSDDVG